MWALLFYDFRKHGHKPPSCHKSPLVCTQRGWRDKENRGRQREQRQAKGANKSSIQPSAIKLLTQYLLASPVNSFCVFLENNLSESSSHNIPRWPVAEKLPYLYMRIKNRPSCTNTGLNACACFTKSWTEKQGLN